MLIIINLYGTYRGFLKIKDAPGGFTVERRGIPESARTFLILASKRTAYELQSDEISGLDIRDIAGVLVALRIDGAWNIIMQGTVRGKFRNTDAVTRELWTNLNRPEPVQAPPPPKKEPSEALKSILNDAEILFSDENEVVPPNKTQNTKSQSSQSSRHAFNPFSKTYPDSVWQRRRFRNGFILEGTVHLAGERLRVQAVPGALISGDGMHEKMGFTRFARDDAGRGYWLRLKYIPK